MCPKNLYKEYNHLVNKKSEILRLEEQERNRLQIIKRQKKNFKRQLLIIQERM
jgi:hypothetical protein